ncbi:putative quinol monooxygenase [Microbispora tritici]|uniref:Antibiotic biosynthesis monooxygenase n=1 Tax=Microbispora tritici TaxID=2604471 RepID=A0ABY3LQC8_9ACTN|nr:putative quinol monooxygenase [Microbispora tritici]TYB45199.1 antibiotic biosynthesis monooxygenase [Microbispora tritici]
MINDSEALPRGDRTVSVCVAILQAKPEHAEEVEATLRDIVDATRDEKGALTFVIPRQGADRFIVYEKYADDAARDAHFGTPYVSGFVARFGELLVAEPQIEFAEELGGFTR